MAQSYVNWNFASEHVQTDIVNGEYVSSESTLVLGGPSRLSHLVGGPGDTQNAVSIQTTMFPIGLLQNASFAQNRQVARIFEIGSKRAYFVPGRLFANFQMSRILFFGPSLMRMLYAVAPYGTGSDELGYGQRFRITDQNDAEVRTPADYDALFGSGPNKRLLSSPGFGGPQNSTDNRDFFINLASDLFNIPIGLCFLFKDAGNNPYGAAYLEDCYLESHTMGIDSNNVVIAENVTGQFGQVAPVQLVTAGN